MTPEELLKTKGIDYRYSGKDLVVHCLNPSHEDNNPSMRIDRLSGKFHCLSCGYGGDIYSLFDEYRNILDTKVLEIKEKIAALNKPTLTIPLGAIPFDKDYRNIKPETFKHFEAFMHYEKEEFEGRVVFPIRDLGGDIVVFHGRYIDSNLKPKYRNYPQNTPLPLFPASPVIVNGMVILVEGIFDVLNLYDKGLKNVVTAFGLATPSKRDRDGSKTLSKFSTLKLQGVQKIVLLLDGDSSGMEAAKKLNNVLKKSYMIEVIELNDGEDPGSMTEDEVIALKEYLNV